MHNFPPLFYVFSLHYEFLFTDLLSLSRDHFLKMLHFWTPAAPLILEEATIKTLISQLITQECKWAYAINQYKLLLILVNPGLNMSGELAGSTPTRSCMEIPINQF